MTDRHGQAAIGVREALVRGDALAAARHVVELDTAHRVEVLLGEAIRRGLDGVLAADAYLAGDLRAVCQHLAVVTPTPLDDEAIGFVLRRHVPERLPGGIGAGAAIRSMPAAAAALSGGQGWPGVFGRIPTRQLSAAVHAYYGLGTLHALGCRPLLILAGCPR